MLFHSLHTRGHHIMARAHGRESLDSTKLHKANILLFLYVLLFTVVLLQHILTNAKNCTQVSWEIRDYKPHWLYFLSNVHVWMWGSFLHVFHSKLLFSSIHINCSLFFCPGVVKLCYLHKLENFAWQKKIKILHHFTKCTSQGLLSVLACISKHSCLYSSRLLHSTAITLMLVIWSVALSLSGWGQEFGW